MDWTLKILAGRHVGAEMKIEQEHIFIGSCSEQSDCVITDVGLAERAIQLTVTEKIIVIKALHNNEWFLNGKRQRSNVVQIELYDVVQVGAIAFTIGRQDASWPTINLPQKRRFRIHWIGILISGLLCIGSLNASLYFANYAPSNEMGPNDSSLRNSSFPNLQLTKKAGQIIVTGYISNQTAALLAKTSIEEREQQSVIWKVYRLDSLRKSIATWLTEHDFQGYDVTVNEKGVATVKGVMHDNIDTTLLSTSVLNDVNGIERINFNISRVKDVISWLNSQFKKANLLNVGASFFKGEILVSGTAKETQKHLMLDLLHSAKKKFGNQVAILYKPFVKPDGIIPVLKAVSANGTPYIELISGKKYLEQSVIGDGFKVEHITENGIALSKNNQRIWIAAGG